MAKSLTPGPNNSPTRADQNIPSESPLGKLTTENATKSNAIEIPQISLPKGGGALKGIDEKFEVNSANGTATFSIPLPLTPSRNDFSPSLSLSYNSGSGNSPYGLGWDVNLPAIQRKTDDRLPRYRDGFEEDVFMFSGAEDLVPMLSEQPDESWRKVEIQSGDFRVLQYRPRVEGDFARIEKINHPLIGTYWKVTTRDNVATIFGRDTNARIADPEDAARVLKWLPEFSYDDTGNWIKYEYKEEDLDNVPDEVYERNRRNGIARFTNKYVKRIRYGNRRPYFAAANRPFDPQPPVDAEHFFTVVFDYGEHDLPAPTPEEELGQEWSYRADAFSSYQAGFEIRTNRLCQRVLMFHQFQELGPEPHLVRSVDLEYEATSINDSGQAEVTYLKSISQSGYIRKADGTYAKRSLPPMEFGYQRLKWNSDVKIVDRESVVNAPAGLSNNYHWLDLYGEGVSGIFTEQSNGWYYKSNLGDVDESGRVRFSQAQPVIPKPSFTGMSTGVLSLQDLDADGTKQIVVNSAGLHGYFELTEDTDWAAFQVFPAIPNIDLSDPNTRLIDLDGDGQPELVVSEEYAFAWYGSKGKLGFEEAEWATKTFDEERGPAVVFGDSQQTIFLADLTGDGLTDIVRIRNGEICYWANKGYGRFGSRVVMGNSPMFDRPDLFNPRYLQLADVSGTGATDIIYLGKNKFKAYLNLSGNAWSDAHEIEPFLPVDTNNRIDVIDLLGTGTACLVWSSDLPSHQHAPMRYIDLMSGSKPHVLTKYVNNLGKETTLEYRSSAYFYLKDKREGKPWVTKLPFPVQVVSKTTVEEKITDVRFSAEYRYHHGYYDHREREFRGFGMVEQIDTEQYETWKRNNAGNALESSEELFQPPVLTRTWFHTGAFLDRQRILTQFRDDYWDKEFERQGFELSFPEPELRDAWLSAAESIADPLIVDELSPDEWREALRSCKGMVLRQEVFALDEPEAETVEDQVKKRLTPFTVVTNNCRIQLLQPRQRNKHAVFIVTESEAVTINYERNEADPRIAHTLNIRIDDLGNILESASVVYPRKLVDSSVPPETQTEQARTFIAYTRNSFTDDIILPQTYRLRSRAEAQTFEITGLVLPASQPLYQVSEFEDLLTNSVAIEYHADPTNAVVQHRLIEHVQTIYYDDNLTAALALGSQGSLGIPFESYQLAYTPELLTAIFGDKLPGNAADLEELLGDNDSDGEQSQCKLVHRDDANWWLRSGQIRFVDAGENITDAAHRFFSPLAYIDPFGSTTRATYFSDYFLMVQSVEDDLENRIRVERFNFRNLSPERVRDPNDNLASAIFDELGLVKATALEGKDLDGDGIAELEVADNLDGIEEATDGEVGQIQAFFEAEDSEILRVIGRDLLGSATTRFVYDYDRYRTSAAAREAEANECAEVRLVPTVTASIVREQHRSVDPLSPIQIGFEYSDGLGRVAMAKVQAEPGIAKHIVVEPDCSFSVTEVDTASQTPERLRWIGNGRTVLNNKGNPVKQYEPYFSVTPHYEDAKELVETGVTPVMYYDALGRLVKTEFPDQTFSKIEFDSWKQRSFDQNDTVEDSEWHRLRVDNLIDAQLIAAGKDPVKEEAAAQKAEAHYDTPSAVHLDTLGRPILSIDHNRIAGIDEFYQTRIVLDIEGNVRSIVDARGNLVMAYKYDMLGHRPYQNSMDSGERWTLNNVAGNPIRRWDGRGQVFFFSYDVLQRPIHSRVTGGDGDLPLDHVYERILYGEEQADDRQLNLRGRPFAHYDTAGKQQFDAYDLKGNLLRGTRRFAADYRNTPDWPSNATDLLLDGADYTFVSESRYDALNRVVWSLKPDGTITEPTFNEAGLLETVSVTQNATSELFVKGIDYNEKAQRTRIVYGNDVLTNYTYDRETFRLIRLETRKADNELIQDLRYTYDPVGNITHLEDRAIPTVFFGNQIVEPAADYTYDALYRLIEATGREHIGQLAFGQTDNWDDNPFLKRYNAGDALAWRNYTQHYQYDAVGNILEMKHVAGLGSWTRDYVYESGSNRLSSTEVGGQTYTYPHHAQHGFITAMPHLQVMRWNFRDELQAVAKQRRNDGGTPETTYYVYDSSGQRVRKVTENSANAGVTPTRKNERLYLGSVEVYREQSGTNASLERLSVHVMDDTRRIAMTETRNAINDGTPARLVRYQLSNHLGSAALELDDQTQVISYEEYHPYGTTSYQAVRSESETAKRYRYTGKERDDETGFYYHGARYYLPWLARWASTDPGGLIDGVNLFAYVNQSPINLRDDSGFVGGSDYADDRTLRIGPHSKTEAAPTPPAESSEPSTLSNVLDFAAFMFSLEFHRTTGQTPKQFGSGMVDKAASVTVDPVVTIYGPEGMLDQAARKGVDLAQGNVKPDEEYVSKEEHAKQLDAILAVGGALFPGFGKIAFEAAVPTLEMGEAAAVGVSGTGVRMPVPRTQGSGPLLKVAGKNKGGSGLAGKQPGGWTKDMTAGRNMSAEQARYQKQVTGRSADKTYHVKGRSFDGHEAGKAGAPDKLVEAKHLGDEGRFARAYENMKKGNFSDLENLVDRSEKILDQARAQVKAAGGTGAQIEWRVSGKNATEALDLLFKNDPALKGKINVVHVPLEPPKP
jgi:RHS repeat-associated protein